MKQHKPKGMTGWQRVNDASLPDEERKEKARQRANAWYLENRERAIAHSRERYKEKRKDPEWRKQATEKTKKKIADLRLQVIEHYGTKCACCEETYPEFLTLDHVNGGGRKHRREIAGTSPYTYWNWFIKNGFPTGFQVLCMNCNFALGLYGYCPHQREE